MCKIQHWYLVIFHICKFRNLEFIDIQLEFSDRDFELEVQTLVGISNLRQSAFQFVPMQVIFWFSILGNYLYMARLTKYKHEQNFFKLFYMLIFKTGGGGGGGGVGGGVRGLRTFKT